MASQVYLTVNVHPGAEGWACTVLLKHPGTPLPRLIRRLGVYPLGPLEEHDLRSAVLAASHALAQAADTIR